MMNKGFSLIECMVYVFCLTIIFGLMGEMVFKFYLRINDDLKVVQQFTHSAVCLNNIICDLFQAMASEAVKKVDYNALVLTLGNNEIVWSLRDDKLYRSFKKFDSESNKYNKSACLMVHNILDFDVMKYIDHSLNSLQGFKITLKLDNVLNSFEHYVAIRGAL